MDIMVNVENLEKRYGQNHVLRGVSFEVRRGEVFALLGMNGAGKTTTMECIEGLRRADDGSITLGGSLGVQLQASSIVAECKVKEAVSLFCHWRRVPVEPTLSLFDIRDLNEKRYGSLSIGQQKKLHVALALIGNPDIVILDEPTAGLDIESRMMLHSEIRKLKEGGTTIVLASHDMAEVEDLCDTIAILRNGRIAFCGPPAELKATVGQLATVAVKTSRSLSEHPFRSSTFLEGKDGYSTFLTDNLGDALFEIASTCRDSGIDVADVRTEHASLEQRFMELSKEGDVA